ncbi:MAG: LPXTG cell wall anchor domain-containing protein [Clostridia bacterium]|nr:LPXTG cell wall anchor domain-containing protein [Clostridia bacterium]
MKTNLKKALVVIMIAIMVISIGTLVTAAEGNYSVGMSLTSNSKLKAGDTVKIDVKLNSISAGDGIDTIAGELTFDKNVFETPTATDFVSTTSWTPTYAASTNMITFMKNQKVTSAETVVTINLKVKDTISVKSTKVTLGDIIVSGGTVDTGGTGDIEVKDISVTISTEATTPTQPGTTNTTTNTKKDSTTNTKTLPKTGLGQLGIILVIVLAVVGIFSYVLYKKTEKYVK